MIDQAKLEKALKHLEVQHANYQHAQDLPELTGIDREAIAESVIQRFETAYDTLWKDLKRHLIDALDESNIPFRVDLHVWDEVPERFHEIIRSEYLALS